MKLHIFWTLTQRLETVYALQRKEQHFYHFVLILIQRSYNASSISYSSMSSAEIFFVINVVKMRSGMAMMGANKRECWMARVTEMELKATAKKHRLRTVLRSFSRVDAIMLSTVLSKDGSLLLKDETS